MRRTRPHARLHARPHARSHARNREHTLSSLFDCEYIGDCPGMNYYAVIDGYGRATPCAFLLRQTSAALGSGQMMSIGPGTRTLCSLRAVGHSLPDSTGALEALLHSTSRRPRHKSHPCAICGSVVARSSRRAAATNHNPTWTRWRCDRASNLIGR